MSLLAAILLFTFGINGITDSDSLDLCKAITSLLHYFLLSSIVWMSIEAYNLYQDLVKVFDTTLISQNEFMCRAGVVGWSKLKSFLSKSRVVKSCKWNSKRSLALMNAKFIVQNKYIKVIHRLACYSLSELILRGQLCIMYKQIKKNIANKHVLAC